MTIRNRVRALEKQRGQGDGRITMRVVWDWEPLPDDGSKVIYLKWPEDLDGGTDDEYIRQ